jgi:hypothetical protein
VSIQPPEFTVKVKTPAVFTVGVAVAPPVITPGPDQEYVPPPEPVRTVVVCAQVIDLVGPAFAVTVPTTPRVLLTVDLIPQASVTIP